MSGELAREVLSYVEEDLLLAPGDVNAADRGNTMAFGFDPGDFEPELVGAALVEVGRRLRERFAGVAGPVVFYAWYDGQAGQLRCSLASVEAEALPFGGSFRVVDSPTEVLEYMASELNPGVVPWSELRPAVATLDVAWPSFPVYVARLAG
ncbi:hypothetical protein AB0I28_33390 [Phytomonospora sp. NPDC050363]|uniref:hypothetical protein n=1 Tax=Phytomonospora sp. NPDC050363 TaxID=3155642 RepID=UPI0034114EAD